MITKGDIERFYKRVEALQLKFPVAAIAEATGQSKYNVSKYLSKKLEPSEAFLNAFYEKFPESGKNVARETFEDDFKSKYLLLLEEENARIKKRQAESLDEMRKILLMNHSILKTLRRAIAQLIAKAEKTDILDVAHRLDTETAEFFHQVSEMGNIFPGKNP